MKVEVTPEQSIKIESALMRAEIELKQKLEEVQSKCNLKESDPLFQSLNQALNTAVQARESFEQAVQNYFTS